MRREERVTVQGPVKEQQPDGMSHRGGVVGVQNRGVAPPWCYAVKKHTTTFTLL